MNNNTINSPIILIKLGKKEYLEQIKNGILRFTKLKRYQEIENPAIGDKDEGLESIAHQDGKMKVTFQHPLINEGKEMDVSNSIKEIRNYPDINVNKYVSCFSFFTQYDVMNKTIFDDLILKETEWPDVLLFIQTDDFVKTLLMALKNFNIQFKPVQYLDYSQNQKGLSEFTKSKKYQYQREIRFSINYTDEQCPYINRIDENIIEIDLHKRFSGIIVPTKDFRNCLCIR